MSPPPLKTIASQINDAYSKASPTNNAKREFCLDVLQTDTVYMILLSSKTFIISLLTLSNHATRR
jgi:hypothetical protein